ncbi:NAD-dependent epimerase/dehydratase family protein [Fodinibius halophilus]|uniref:NAD-dependent epimerase/dehydratase family protein n=1 Tax=Fodinibius halophilus TaxID=1736908 RepID=A0A6M1T6G9_9BACT|nr:NAD-dependent epimerase/dehydratase family protein [Fodinibius halophilus]NGP87621.1 NAD-dependent epimerase/dehydratase family protein [Fodinibius halophilus]
MGKILITGACGQLGSELTEKLRSIYGKEEVVATDIQDPPESISDGPFEYLDVMKKDAIAKVIDEHDIKEVYHLAALLSAKAEQNIELGWKLNMDGLLHVLNLAKEKSLDKIFWPSSIAVFGPDAPSKDTGQNVALNPTTVYGISKMAGEQWCSYFHENFGVDVRSLRYPGLIGYKSLPGGGTTDYAVDIHYKALKNEPFSCFLDKDNALPMMYMEDAIDATIQLMQADESDIEIRTSYNLSAISFTPEEIAEAIKKHMPGFEISYDPDYRKKIADSWPDSIDDSPAREQWGWNHEYDLNKMVGDMLANIPKANPEMLKAKEA